MKEIRNVIDPMRWGDLEKGLRSLTRYIKRKTIMAEIGCYAGEGTMIFLNSNKIKKLYAIDPWQSGYDENDGASSTNMKMVEDKFDERTKSFNNVVKLKMTFEEAFDKLPELDFIYIDGNHQYEFVLSDIKLALRKIKDGGIISGHDYGSDKHIGVTKAVNEIFGKPDKIFNDQSWLVKIKK